MVYENGDVFITYDTDRVRTSRDSINRIESINRIMSREEMEKNLNLC